MASVSPHSPWFHSLKSTNNNSFSSSFTKPTSRNFSFLNTLKASSSSSSPSPNSEPENPSSEPDGKKTDPVKLAFEKAKAYRKSVQSNSAPVPKIVRNESDDSGLVVKESEAHLGPEDQNQKIPQNSVSEKIAGKKENFRVSSIDFVGLGFADKKISRELPPGLVPISEPYPDGGIPDVEILVGDIRGFANNIERETKMVEEDESEVYKPKVSTWGVFPRPSNISKTFGGGRVIRPGEQLETVEDKATKQKRTRELLAAYRKRTGINIDPKLKLECEKILEDGDSLMDLGKLKEALTFYQEVMDKLPFQSELHGLAALQWSICQDSLNRVNEARVMYEKLQSHPSYKVSKKARQFMFGFQAMEMMKVKSSSGSATNTGYQNFFEAFIQKNIDFSLKDTQVEEQGEGVLSQAIPYIFFLVSPIFLVLFIAVRMGI